MSVINKAVITFDADEETLEQVQKNFTGEIFRFKKRKPEKLEELLFEAIGKHRKEIFGLALFKWMKIKDKDRDEMTFPVDFNLTFYDYYIKHNKEKIRLLDGSFEVVVKFGFIYPQLISGRALKDSTGSTKANSIDIKIQDDLESHMIIKPDEGLDFYVTDKGTTRKLETLFTYDPKTDKISKPK